MWLAYIDQLPKLLVPGCLQSRLGTDIADTNSIQAVQAVFQDCYVSMLLLLMCGGKIIGPMTD